MSTLKEQVYKDVIGVAATPVTLTASFADNRDVMVTKYLPNVHLDVKYTPNAASTNAYVQILVEASNDEGTTWFPLSVKVTGTTEVDVFADSATGMGTASGVSFVIPGDKTSTGGTAVSASFDLTVVAEQLRISAKESVGSNFGTVYVRATAQT